MLLNRAGNSRARRIHKSDCCDGLVKTCDVVGAEDQCEQAMFSTCLPCGNGTCDELENQCNCPEDCP